MSEESKLSNKQLLAITHILNSPSIEEACKKIGIARSTYYAWLKIEAFKAELKRQRDETVESALNSLKFAITKAVEELIRLTEAKREEVRRLACHDIIAYVLKSVEIEEIEKRLDSIEKIVFKKRIY